MHETPAPVDLWEEIGSCEHLVQFYDDSHTLVESLSGFIGSSLHADAAGIVIATEQHLQALEQQLAASGIDIVAAKSRGQYVPLDAKQLLPQIMANGWPQPDLFRSKVSSVVSTACARWGSVRAFGEMVGLLWEGGLHGAAIRLEGLWNELAQTERFALLCGYHVEQLRAGDMRRVKDICAVHAHAFVDYADPMPVSREKRQYEEKIDEAAP